MHSDVEQQKSTGNMKPVNIDGLGEVWFVFLLTGSHCFKYIYCEFPFIDCRDLMSLLNVSVFT